MRTLHLGFEGKMYMYFNANEDNHPKVYEVLHSEKTPL